jgi:hypothetical protein
MPLQLSRTASIMGLTLVGAWSGLAFGLGTLLSAPLDDVHPTSAVSIQRALRTASFDVMDTDPCTKELVEVEPRLTILIVKNGEAGGTSSEVEVRIENHPGTAAMDGISPLVRHFAFDVTWIGGTPSTHSFRTPLAGRHGSLDLVVDLVGTLDAGRNASFSMSSSRIDARRSPCSTVPAGQAVPQLVKLVLAN